MDSKIQFTLFLCLIVAVLVSPALSSLQERRCVTGKSYNDGCNECSCLDGRRACTILECVEWDPIRKENVTKSELPPPSDFWEPIVELPLPRA